MHWQTGHKSLGVTIPGQIFCITRIIIRDHDSGKEYMIAERMWISIHVPVSTREVGILQDRNLKTQGWPLNLRPANAWDNTEWEGMVARRSFLERVTSYRRNNVGANPSYPPDRPGHISNRTDHLTLADVSCQQNTTSQVVQINQPSTTSEATDVRRRLITITLPNETRSVVRRASTGQMPQLPLPDPVTSISREPAETDTGMDDSTILPALSAHARLKRTDSWIKQNETVWGSKIAEMLSSNMIKTTYTGISIINGCCATNTKYPGSKYIRCHAVGTF